MLLVGKKSGKTQSNEWQHSYVCLLGGQSSSVKGLISFVCSGPASDVRGSAPPSVPDGECGRATGW